MIYFAIPGRIFANCKTQDVPFINNTLYGRKIAIYEVKKGGFEMSKLISPGDVMLMLNLDLTFEEVLDLTAGLTAHIPFKTWYKIIKVRDDGVVTNMKITYIGFDKLDVSRFFKKHDPWKIIKEGRELRNQGRGVVPKRYILRHKKWIEYTKVSVAVSDENLVAAL